MEEKKDLFDIFEEEKKTTFGMNIATSDNTATTQAPPKKRGRPKKVRVGEITIEPLKGQKKKVVKKVAPKKMLDDTVQPKNLRDIINEAKKRHNPVPPMYNRVPNDRYEPPADAICTRDAPSPFDRRFVVKKGFGNQKVMNKPELECIPMEEGFAPDINHAYCMELARHYANDKDLSQFFTRLGCYLERNAYNGSRLVVALDRMADGNNTIENAMRIQKSSDELVYELVVLRRHLAKLAKAKR